jgi:hypothetical protein
MRSQLQFTFTLLLHALIPLGCVTNDFKVVDALQPNMTAPEARSTIAAHGFERHETSTRPETGWSLQARDMTRLAVRAHYIEDLLGIRVATAEYYPVYHGLMGFGELFLFYNDQNRLVYFYRHQIN